MPIQTKSQKIGEKGQDFVKFQVSSSRCWIAHNISPDYGIDLELQFAPEDEEVRPMFIKAQIKSSQNVDVNSDYIIQTISKSFLRYVHECRVPVILILASTSFQQSWYIWLQKWIMDSGNASRIYDESKKKSLSIKVSKSNDFANGLNKELISIASLENPTQLYLAVRDLANLSCGLFDDSLSQFLFDYLNKMRGSLEGKNYLDSLIDRVIDLNSYIKGTTEGNNVSKLLFQYIREHGNNLNAEHVSRLVCRGNKLSNTGINALGILYDNFPQHALSLKLTTMFIKAKYVIPHYYCSIRERYLEQKSPGWASKKNDLRVGNLTLDLTSDDFLNKWANRGDAAFLSYLIEI
ncbi:MAG: hypothetical protein LEGION0403_FIIPPAGN_02730 [Legionella sp.]|uniref:DUF4365 domain-containing protein n=1 Tax=Legionella sp. TaxID=459 RepID=UPI003D150C5D